MPHHSPANQDTYQQNGHTSRHTCSPAYQDTAYQQNGHITNSTESNGGFSNINEYNVGVDVQSWPRDTMPDPGLSYKTKQIYTNEVCKNLAPSVQSACSTVDSRQSRNVFTSFGMKGKDSPGFNEQAAPRVPMPIINVNVKKPESLTVLGEKLSERLRLQIEMMKKHLEFPADTQITTDSTNSQEHHKIYKNLDQSKPKVKPPTRLHRQRHPAVQGLSEQTDGITSTEIKKGQVNEIPPVDKNPVGGPSLPRTPAHGSNESQLPIKNGKLKITEDPNFKKPKMTTLLVPSAELYSIVRDFASKLTSKLITKRFAEQMFQYIERQTSGQGPDVTLSNFLKVWDYMACVQLFSQIRNNAHHKIQLSTYVRSNFSVILNRTPRLIHCQTKYESTEHGEQSQLTLPLSILNIQLLLCRVHRPYASDQYLSPPTDGME